MYTHKIKNILYITIDTWREWNRNKIEDEGRRPARDEENDWKNMNDFDLFSNIHLLDLFPTKPSSLVLWFYSEINQKTSIKDAENNFSVNF